MAHLFCTPCARNAYSVRYFSVQLTEMSKCMAGKLRDLARNCNFGEFCTEKTERSVLNRPSVRTPRNVTLLLAEYFPVLHSNSLNFCIHLSVGSDNHVTIFGSSRCLGGLT
jgi:hypothetical protein